MISIIFFVLSFGFLLCRCLNWLFSDIDRQMMLEDTTRDKKLGDMLLGTCEVPLSTVLTHRTGNRN